MKEVDKMRVKFIFKNPALKKASDSAMSELDLERSELEEQLYYWQDVLFDYERHGRGDAETAETAKQRIADYRTQLGDDEYKATDMPVSTRTVEVLEPGNMTQVVENLRRFLRRDTPVLLLGASGFGKSELAKKAANLD